MPSAAPNAQYNVAAADSLPVKIAAHQRRKMFARFLADTRVGADDTVLDVGATSERTYEASNYLEAWYPHKDKVTAIGLDDASFLATLYPGMRFLRADALALPFADAAFDVVHAAAVIEHVGAFERQCGLLHECCRVARSAVFVTTPNRWFPIEFHTVLPVVHWLPRAAVSPSHAPYRPQLFRGGSQSQPDDRAGIGPCRRRRRRLLRHRLHGPPRRLAKQSPADDAARPRPGMRALTGRREIQLQYHAPRKRGIQ